MVVRWLLPFHSTRNRVDATGEELYRYLRPDSQRSDTVCAELIRKGESSKLVRIDEYPIGVAFSRGDIVRSFNRDTYSSIGDTGKRHTSPRGFKMDVAEREVWIPWGAKPKAILVFDDPTPGVYDLAAFLSVPIDVLKSF